MSGESAKLTATQIFAFQNDRGLGLTTLEKLKAFLMHQIYRNNTTNVISNIHSIEAKFASIYNYIEKLETKEDTVLGYHCSAFLSSYDSPLDAIRIVCCVQMIKLSGLTILQVNYADPIL